MSKERPNIHFPIEDKAMSVIALNTRKEELYKAQEAILNAAQERKTALTTVETEKIDQFTNEIKDLEKQVKTLDAITIGRAGLSKATSEIVVPQNDSKKPGSLSKEYLEGFYGSFAGGVGNAKAKMNKFVNAALGEGGTTDGGYLVPTIGPEGAIVALAPLEASMRKLALVISTTNDLKLAAQLSKTVAHQRASDSRSSNVAFTASQPTFTQVTLSAYMSGAFVPVTIELAQDVPALQGFLSADLARGVNNFEENVFINGSGSGEAEGILAGADLGQTGALTAENSLDFTATLRNAYYSNAQWLMHRITGIQFRKEQLSDNQFLPYFLPANAPGGQDTFHGFPVNYSSAMPYFIGSPESDGKVAFGDFKTCAVIGDRGGPALQVVTDNLTQLENAVIRVYGYRRTDMRVRVSEAVKVWDITSIG